MLPEVRVWTDGSGTVDAPMGWAYVMEFDARSGIVVKECCGGAVRGTNNRAELMGPIRALEDLTRPCRVHLTTDSQYVCHAFMRDWISGWKRKSWRGVKNADLWHRLLRAVDRHDVRWYWTKGHSGQPQNERCDVLAGEARRDIALAERDGTLVHLPFEVMDLHMAEQLSLV